MQVVIFLFFAWNLYLFILLCYHEEMKFRLWFVSRDNKNVKQFSGSLQEKFQGKREWQCRGEERMDGRREKNVRVSRGKCCIPSFLKKNDFQLRKLFFTFWEGCSHPLTKANKGKWGNNFPGECFLSKQAKPKRKLQVT